MTKKKIEVSCQYSSRPSKSHEQSSSTINTSISLNVKSKKDKGYWKQYYDDRPEVREKKKLQAKENYRKKRGIALARNKKELHVVSQIPMDIDPGDTHDFWMANREQFIEIIMKKPTLNKKTQGVRLPLPLDIKESDLKFIKQQVQYMTPLLIHILRDKKKKKYRMPFDKINLDANEFDEEKYGKYI